MSLISLSSLNKKSFFIWIERVVKSRDNCTVREVYSVQTLASGFRASSRIMQGSRTFQTLS